MKVTGIHTFLCHAYRTNWVFVKVRTSEGLHGIGEATLEMRELTVAQACRELERSLVGRDAFDIEAFWHDAYRDAYWRGGPVLMSALSAVEMALWDIKGKALGVPVWQLLGGKVRDRVPCYANGWFAPAVTPAEFAEKACLAVARGFRGLKWDPFGQAYRTIENPPSARPSPVSRPSSKPSARKSIFSSRGMDVSTCRRQCASLTRLRTMISLGSRNPSRRTIPKAWPG